MASHIDAEYLKRVSLFKGMSDEQIEDIARVMKIRRVKANETIIREGETGDEMYLLLKGSISVTKRLTMHGIEGDDQVDKSLINLHAADNAFFGEMNLLGSEQRSATVRALTDVELGVLTHEQVLKLADADPLLGFYNIGTTLAGHLRRTNLDVLKLATALCLALEGG